uniref:Uncharacterized protein n=1 Tax=Megaselia scalaris TaxID=36166 RepID=T1GJC7_MEGSC
MKFADVVLEKSVSKKSTKSSRDIESDSDSDSSLDNYLVHPDKIDIATSFFERKENLPASTSKQSEEFNTGCLTQISTPKPESNIANFGHLIDHLQKVEDLKKKASDEVELKSRRPARYSLEDDIRETLAKMEAIPVPKSVKKKRKHGRDSEVESDWEEVEGQ